MIEVLIKKELIVHFSLLYQTLTLNICKKRILKDVAKRYLPLEVISHKKWGFAILMHKVLEKEFIEKFKYLIGQFM